MSGWLTANRTGWAAHRRDSSRTRRWLPRRGVPQAGASHRLKRSPESGVTARGSLYMTGKEAVTSDDFGRKIAYEAAWTLDHFGEGRKVEFDDLGFISNCHNNVGPHQTIPRPTQRTRGRNPFRLQPGELIIWNESAEQQATMRNPTLRRSDFGRDQNQFLSDVWPKRAENPLQILSGHAA